MIRTAFIVAALAVTCAAQPAFAGTDPSDANPYGDRPAIRVRIADLDLSKPADREKMAQRVERAARRICDSEVTRRERRTCAAETVEYAMNFVSPGVRRAYAAASDRRESFALAGN